MGLSGHTANANKNAYDVAVTNLKEHIEFLQFIDTKGSLCDDGPDLKTHK